MFFSSTPAYHDPSNWQQQPNHQGGASNTQTISTQLLPPPPPQPHGGAGSIRPGSMADRARLANIPIPEAALKCPRCESTNTKFCYFNNYSLTQPRHFCKTCRRYWTRGGALRNVPVGGGCRRNKRSKGNTSHKSPVSGGSSINSVSSNADILSNLGPQAPPLRFMAPSDHSHVGFSYGSVLSNQIGEASGQLNFQMGSGLASSVGLGTSVVSSSVGGGSLLALGGLDQWRWFQQGQQLPFFSGLDSSSNSSAFESGLEPSSYVGGLTRPNLSSSGAIQMGSVKMEESQEINLSRQFSGINHGNDQCWSTGCGWTDLSSFRSSSSSNPL